MVWITNPDIDWRTREVRYRQLQESTHRVSTISLHQLREEGHKEAMFLFTILVHPSSNIKEESLVQLSAKYHAYADVFDKVKADTLPHHRPYDCPIIYNQEQRHHGDQFTTCHQRS